jgi:hypothetical protein
MFGSREVLEEIGSGRFRECPGSDRYPHMRWCPSDGVREEAAVRCHRPMRLTRATGEHPRAVDVVTWSSRCS